MINFSRIENNIFIGTAPQSEEDINTLKQEKITSVLSLQSDSDLTNYRIDWKNLCSRYQYNDIAVQRFQIIDFDENDLASNLMSPIKALDSMFNDGQTVYVHCNAGICRAPATVLGYLCHYRGLTLEDGLAHIRKNRPQANPYTRAISKALAQLAEERRIVD